MQPTTDSGIGKYSFPAAEVIAQYKSQYSQQFCGISSPEAMLRCVF
jgi:hypothetical protein